MEDYYISDLTAKGEYASSKISGHFDSFECPINFLDLSVTIRDRMKKKRLLFKKIFVEFSQRDFKNSFKIFENSLLFLKDKE